MHTDFACLINSLLKHKLSSTSVYKIVAEGVNKLRSKQNAIVLVTHYQRLLNYIKPDFVHVLANGKIIQTGDASLALELEQKGYDWLM